MSNSQRAGNAPKPKPTGFSRQRWQSTRFHIVSGKGGTGKTTVAASLAIALATGGKRVLLIEVEERQGLAQLFDTPPLPYEERKIAIAPGSGEVFALAIDTEEALLDYLQKFYNLKRAGTALKKAGAIDFATTVAPGVRDVLLTGKSIEAVKRKEGSRQAYDAVVMDAPPTGRIGRFLNATAEVSNIAKVGPIKKQADTVMEVVTNKKTMIHLVTLLEEMPVQETLDGIEELRTKGFPFGAVFVNMTKDRHESLDGRQIGIHDYLQTDPSESDREDAIQLIQEGLEQSGLPKKFANAKTSNALYRELEDHAQRIELESREWDRLEQSEEQLIELPYLSSGIDLGALYELAEVIRDQVGA